MVQHVTEIPVFVLENLPYCFWTETCQEDWLPTLTKPLKISVNCPGNTLANAGQFFVYCRCIMFS